MSSDNNKASPDPLADPLDAAIAALRSAPPADERPSPALVAATIDSLRRLEATMPENPAGQTAPAAQPVARPSTTDVEVRPSPNAGEPSRRIPRFAIWAAALAAAVCVTIIVNRPVDQPPGPPMNRDIHTFGPIVLSELDPQPVYARMDEQIAQTQSAVATLIDQATRIQAEQQIARLLADSREMKGAAMAN